MDGSNSSDAMRDRVDWSGIRLWLLLAVNRWLLTAAILATAFVVLVALSQVGLSPLRRIVENQDGLEFLFSAFIGAIITGTSIVVTINQLVLSQELGAIGDQRERMTASMEFRRDVEAELEEGVSPPEPSGFLYELLDGIEMKAERLVGTMEDERDEELREAIEQYVDELTANARRVMDELEDAQFGTFEVIWYALDFNYSRKIYEARQLRHDHADSLSADASEAIDELIEVLKFFGPAREHFKTLYFQWALIDLSRALLYISVPALVVMGGMIMYVDAAALLGTTLGVDNLVWLTSAGFVVGIAPFVVFTVYILRVASVAKRTLAMGPYILRESEREQELG